MEGVNDVEITRDDRGKESSPRPYTCNRLLYRVLERRINLWDCMRTEPVAELARILT